MRKYLWLAMLAFGLDCCTEKVPPTLYSTIESFAFDDFVYTNNGYLLIFKNYDSNEPNFTLYLKADDAKKQPQPVFPLSRKDTLFASNLIYALVEKEGESWLLFDKTSDKKPDKKSSRRNDNKPDQKRYRLARYDFLRRTVDTSYTIVPIAGRDFINAYDLQIDDGREMMFYFDKSQNDFVAINLKDGTSKYFSFPIAVRNPAAKALLPDEEEHREEMNFRLVLNKQAATLFLIELNSGKLYSVDENYLIGKQFFSRDIQSQIKLQESGLKNVVDIDFDENNRPIIATTSSIYLIRKNDKVPIIDNFKNGTISSISYANRKVFFNAKTSRNYIFYASLDN